MMLPELSCAGSERERAAACILGPAGPEGSGCYSPLLPWPLTARRRPALSEMAAAATSPALRKMASSAVRAQARGMASSGGEAWGRAAELSQQLGSIVKKEMTETNWSEARRTWEKMSKLMKEPPEALSLQDIKLSQLQAELCQVKADAKFYTSASYAVYGVFGCFLIAIPTQMMYGDLKLETEMKQCKESLESIKNRVSAMETGIGVAVEEDAEEEIGAEDGNTTVVGGWFSKWF